MKPRNMVIRTTSNGGEDDVGRPTTANSASTNSSLQPLAIKDFASPASPTVSSLTTPGRSRNPSRRMSRSVSFHHGSVIKPERSQTNNLERTATNDTWSSMDESDADTISSVSEDGRYRPQFLPGHLLNRLRHRQREEAEETEDDTATLESLPAKPPIPTYRTTPLASGALAPFAIMLEVPGLTTRWYVRRVGTETIYQDNPPLLQVGLALSIASAIVANIMLVLRFSNLVKPRKATLSAVIGFLIHDAINTAALTAFGIIHAVDDGYGYSQAYWMTVAATAASVACTITLAIDYIRTRDFGSSGSGLTNKQTQLVIVVMVLLVYLSIGSLIWSLMLNLVFETALYFTVTTTLAVGFGDFTPNTTAARIVLFFYAPIGITLFAVTIYIARGTLIESFENSYRKKRQAFHDRVKQRRKEMKELRVQKRQWRKMMKNSGSSGAIQSGRGVQRIKTPWRQHPASTANGHTVQPTDGSSKASRLATWLSMGLTNGFSSSSSKTEEVTSEKLNGTALESFQFHAENGTPLDPTESRDEEEVDSNGRIDDVETMEATLAAQRREMEKKWSEFRQDLIKREQAEFWSKLTVSLVLFLSFWLLGAMVFHFTEGWTYFEAFYFCFVLFTTIGYGDYTPKSDAGRSFFIIWSLMGVGVLTILISVFSDAWGSVITSRLDKTKEKLKERSRRLRAKLRGSSNRRRAAEGSDDENDQSADEDQDTQGMTSLSRLGSRIQDQDDNNATAGILKPSSGSAGATAPGSSTDLPQSLDGQSSNDATPSWLSLSPHQLSDLPLQLAKSALALQEFASRHIQSRQEGLLVSLDDLPALKQHLPKHVGGDIPSNTWSSMPMDSIDPSSGPTTSSHLGLARHSLASSTNAPAVQDCLALISYLSLEAQIKEVVRRAGDMRTCLVESQSRVEKAERKVEELERIKRWDSPLAQDEDEDEIEGGQREEE